MIHFSEISDELALFDRQLLKRKHTDRYADESRADEQAVIAVRKAEKWITRGIYG